MRPRKLALLTLVLLAAAARLYAQNPATQPAATTTAYEDPREPATKSHGTQSFLNQHQSFLQRKTEGPIEVLFLGDSITAGWANRGKDVWAAHYADYQPANFGISGDRTQHVLWRIANGELDGLHPQVTVLMIGTNNLGTDDAAEIAEADTKIVRQILEKSGGKVLLLAIFPRGSVRDTPQVLAKIPAINAELAKLDNGNTVHYLDIGKVFLGADGKINKDVMPDGLHPNAQGYQLWAEAMQPLFEQMAKKPTAQPSP